MLNQELDGEEQSENEEEMAFNSLPFFKQLAVWDGEEPELQPPQPPEDSSESGDEQMVNAFNMAIDERNLAALKDADISDDDDNVFPAHHESMDDEEYVNDAYDEPPDYEISEQDLNTNKRQRKKLLNKLRHSPAMLQNSKLITSYGKTSQMHQRECKTCTIVLHRTQLPSITDHSERRSMLFLKLTRL